MKTQYWYKCKKCGSMICGDTGYDYIPCACGAIAIDGGPHYIRVIGNAEDIEILELPKEETD